MAIYTQPSISGYNASPPPDDGSSTSANELTWAKHKDKLADPIKTYAEAVDANVLAAFDRIPFIKVLAKTGDYTLVNTDRGSLISVTNTTTITLLSAASAGLGWSITFFNAGTGTVTIDGDSAETINGSATIALLKGQSLILTSDGTNWVAIVVIGLEGIFTKGADVASAAALTLGTDGSYFDITGTTTITSIATRQEYGFVKLHFDASLTLTHHATDLILPGGVDIVTEAGDEVEFTEYASGDWRCTNYTRTAFGASTISGYVGGDFIYMEDDAGIDATSFNIAAVIGAAWESIGPTGSGATNIFTAMDSIPSTGKWVKLKIENSCTDSGFFAVFQYVFGRATGSSRGDNVTTIISSSVVSSAGSSAVVCITYNSLELPIDSSQRFDLLLAADGTSRSVVAYLVGFGV